MTPRLRHYLVACALCIITLIAYVNSFQSGFVFDNNFLVLGDSRIHQATRANLALILNHSYWWPYAESGLYRPLTTLSYLFNYAILGNAAHPAGYHWINLLLHAGNVLLVFALAQRLVAEAPDHWRRRTETFILDKLTSTAIDRVKGTSQSDFWPSFAIAAVWAVHPVLTESVTNIVGRADLLAGMTTLGGLLIYLRSTETTGWRRLAWLAGLAAVTGLGVFSKESAVALPAVIALYELTWWNRQRLRGFFLACIAMSPALLAMWWIRSRVLAAPAVFPFVDNPIAGAGFWTGRLTAVKVMAKYLELLVWPAHLSADYSYRQIPLADASRPADWIAWIVVAAVAVGVAFLYRRSKVAFFAAGFAFVSILPTANLVIPVGTIMAERFLYLPAIGFAMCLTLALYSLGRRVGVGVLTPVGMLASPVLCCLIVMGFTARTWARNADWVDDLTLWSAAAQTSPLSFKTHTALAKILLRAKDPDGDRIFKEDETGLALLDSLPDNLNDALLYYDVGGQYVLIGDSLRRIYPDGKVRTPPESISKYERARKVLLRSLSILRAQHKDPDAYTYLMLSQIDYRLGKNDDSLHSAREAQDVQPMVSAVYQRIHEVLITAGRREEAMTALMEGMLLTSDPALEKSLVVDYAANPVESKCTVARSQGVFQIDFSCPAVRKQVCSVSGEAIRLTTKARGQDAAAHMKSDLAAKYGCS